MYNMSVWLQTVKFRLGDPHNISTTSKRVENFRSDDTDRSEFYL